MSKIHIQLFGRFCVRCDGRIVTGLGAGKLQELFGYLLLHPHRALSREALAGLLWPDTLTAQSKKKLRQLLWHLQSALGSQTQAPHDRLFLVEPDQIQLNAETGLWLDVDVFEKTFECINERTGQELGVQHMQALYRAVQLYRGPLLEGCYGDWCLYQRERLQNMYLTLLDKLISYCETHHDYEAGIQYGLRILNCDRAHERTYRRLMRLHYLSGNRAAALRLYEQCATALDEELSVKPSKRTRALYQQILTEQLVEPKSLLGPSSSQPVLAGSNIPLIEALGHLTQLQEALTDLQSQVQQCLQQIEQALGKNLPPSLLMKADEGKDGPETLGRRSRDAQSYHSDT
jgi:DNA-binding SARP family transcriptional activator